MRGVPSRPCLPTGTAPSAGGFHRTRAAAGRHDSGDEAHGAGGRQQLDGLASGRLVAQPLRGRALPGNGIRQRELWTHWVAGVRRLGSVSWKSARVLRWRSEVADSRAFGSISLDRGHRCSLRPVRAGRRMGLYVLPRSVRRGDHPGVLRQFRTEDPTASVRERIFRRVLAPARWGGLSRSRSRGPTPQYLRGSAETRSRAVTGR